MTKEMFWDSGSGPDNILQDTAKWYEKIEPSFVL